MGADGDQVLTLIVGSCRRYFPAWLVGNIEDGPRSQLGTLRIAVALSTPIECKSFTQSRDYIWKSGVHANSNLTLYYGNWFMEGL